MSGDMRLRCRLARVHGRVQGVGFREACVAQAQLLGLSGWVRNRSDGTVEVLVQGPDAALEAMLRWLHRGPPAARVSAVAAREATAPVEGLVGFARRPTA
jgi:acylphosphatase